MKTNDHDLTLHALDRLPPGEARELESNLADDPQLAAELRAIEDTMTAIWHAASPLAAAPAGSFGEIQARLHPLRQRRFKTRVIASAGWAAALVLFAVLMVGRQSPLPSAMIPLESPVAAADPPAVDSGQPVTSATRLENSTAQRKLRENVLALQQELRTARSGLEGPRIRVLRPPGAGGSGVSSDPALALRDLLTAALTEDLARRTEVATTLTVETGWMPAAFSALPAGSVVRHRSFPAEEYSAYGLLLAANGDFYDPATHFLWTPAEDGGGYLGSMAPPSLDLAAFESSPPESGVGKSRNLSPQGPAGAQPADIEPNRKPVPTGYLVQGSGDEKATVIIGNLPTTDPTAQLIASVNGGATTFPLTDGVIVPGPDGIGFASFNLPASLVGNMSVGAGSRGLIIFQANSAGPATIVLTTEPAAGGE